MPMLNIEDYRKFSGDLTTPDAELLKDFQVFYPLAVALIKDMKDENDNEHTQNT